MVILYYYGGKLKMPTVNITIYFNENDYTKYAKKKETVNKKVRDLVKGMIK